MRAAAGRSEDSSGARGIVRNKADRAQTEMLAVTFVVTKSEQLVVAQRAAERRAKVIALKLRDLCLVEIIACVQRAIAQKFIHRAVELCFLQKR